MDAKTQGGSDVEVDPHGWDGCQIARTEVSEREGEERGDRKAK